MGDDAGSELRLRPHQSRDPGARPERDLLDGPGHGGPGLVANTYLEGTYTEVYPHITRDAEGLRRLFRQFSFPGGIPSHVAPETPGSIHEGGELGYALLHAYGAVFDNPDLLACCVVGDGEAETGPLAASWHSNKFLNPARDGAVLPVLHLNGYKIANPTVLARIPEHELRSLFEGYGYAPRFVEGSEPDAMLLPNCQRRPTRYMRAVVGPIERGCRQRQFLIAAVREIIDREVRLHAAPQVLRYVEIPNRVAEPGSARRGIQPPLAEERPANIRGSPQRGFEYSVRT